MADKYCAFLETVLSAEKDKCLEERVEEPHVSIGDNDQFFYLYSFVGWFYESTICSFVNHRHFY